MNISDQDTAWQIPADMLEFTQTKTRSCGQMGVLAWYRRTSVVSLRLEYYALSG